MVIKNLIAVSFATAILFGAGSVSAANITFTNDGTVSGTQHAWNSAASFGGSAYDPAVVDPIGVAPAQTGANSGGYSTKASWVSTFSNDIWSFTTDANTSATFSIDYTNTLLSIGGSAIYTSAADALAGTNAYATAGASHLLTAAPFGGYSLNSIGFTPVSLSTGITYYLAITGGSYIGNALNSASYIISTPSSDYVSTPLPAAVWLFGTGIAGLVGASKRKKETVATLAV